MLTDVSKVIEINKINDLRLYIVSHCNYFFDVNFSFQSCLCNGCHNLMERAMVIEFMIIEFIFELRAKMKP